MTIDQRSQQSAVDVARYGGMIRLGLKIRNGFIPIPKTFELIPNLVHISAAIAMRKVFGVEILECFFGHKTSERMEIGVNYQSPITFYGAAAGGTGVKVGVLVGVPLGESTTRKRPITFQSYPMKICT